MIHRVYHFRSHVTVVAGFQLMALPPRFKQGDAQFSPLT